MKKFKKYNFKNSQKDPSSWKKSEFCSFSGYSANSYVHDEQNNGRNKHMWRFKRYSATKKQRKLTTRVWTISTYIFGVAEYEPGIH